MVGYENTDVSEKDGSHQVEYENEDPCIVTLYYEELAKRGLKSKMGEFVGAR